MPSSGEAKPCLSLAKPPRIQKEDAVGLFFLRWCEAVPVAKPPRINPKKMRFRLDQPRNRRQANAGPRSRTLKGLLSAPAAGLPVTEDEQHQGKIARRTNTHAIH
mmetsp:Transcript_20160/g.41830  ORF Transcript_20160/g.41830 Transcript_20160/m.41830 type:complete len:105 (-) Transcript_20160:83-397(-)